METEIAGYPIEEYSFATANDTFTISRERPGGWSLSCWTKTGRYCLLDDSGRPAFFSDPSECVELFKDHAKLLEQWPSFIERSGSPALSELLGEGKNWQAVADLGATSSRS